jgi:hypothetical protein
MTHRVIGGALGQGLKTALWQGKSDQALQIDFCPPTQPVFINGGGGVQLRSELPAPRPSLGELDLRGGQTPPSPSGSTNGSTAGFTSRPLCRTNAQVHGRCVTDDEIERWIAEA